MLELFEELLIIAVYFNAAFNFSFKKKSFNSIKARALCLTTIIPIVKTTTN